ncbi:hypothetical protein [Flavimaricola marinus]|uniref:Uncharacterized protein n=1 Tax=Flavimaricola marinus TaxID=1819565 RepID=A0A238LL04_9RHOB|nr:hypothetical protein [Flavimaricola marinus]SMY10397.1 hypothetical protein LOM8899_04579 [Flavimaricola marinus]
MTEIENELHNRATIAALNAERFGFAETALALRAIADSIFGHSDKERRPDQGGNCATLGCPGRVIKPILTKLS